MSAERELAEVIVAHSQVGPIHIGPPDKELTHDNIRERYRICFTCGPISADGTDFEDHVASAILAAGWHSPEQHAQAVEKARREALESAADEVKRVREQGLAPDEEYGPNSERFEQWLHERARGEGGGK